MSLDLYHTDDLDRENNKSTVLLAYSRYQEQIGNFVNSLQRLAYAEPEIKRIVKECSEETGADQVYVEKHLKQIISDSLPATDDMPKTKPEKIKLEFPHDGRPQELGYGGGPPSPPLKYDPAKVNPEPDEVTTVDYATPPLLEDETREPDQVHNLKDETIKWPNKNNFSHVVEADASDPHHEHFIQEAIHHKGRLTEAVGGPPHEHLDKVRELAKRGDGLGAAARLYLNVLRPAADKKKSTIEQEACAKCGCGCDKDCDGDCKCKGDCPCKTSKVIASLTDEQLEEFLDLREEAQRDFLASLTKEAPYGVPKSKGGDSPENDSKMERCVSRVMAEGHSKESAIRICKASIFGGKDSCVRCSSEITEGVVCSACEDKLLKKASPYMQPMMGIPLDNPNQQQAQGMQPNVCPQCGANLEGQDMASHMATHQNENAAQNPESMQMGLNQMQTMMPSMYTHNKEALMEDHLDIDPNPRPGAPIQGPQPEDRTDGLVNQDQLNPRSSFDDVVSSFANQAAAKKFSTPTDEDITAVSEQTGLNPNDIAQNLKLIAKFGDITAVNGVVDADDDVGSYQEIQGLGGPVQDQEAEIPLQLAIAKVSQDSNMDENMIMNELKDSFGNQDLPQEYHVPLTGGRKFYLPREMMAGSQNPMSQPEPGQELQNPVPDIESEYE